MMPITRLSTAQQGAMYRVPSPGYGAPQQQGYGALQQQGYGAPQQQGYGAPQQQGYRALQQQGYGTPQQQGYGAPQPQPQGHEAPPGYGAPPQAQATSSGSTSGAAWVPGATSTEAPPYPWGTIPDSDPEDDENATEEGGPNPDPQELEPVPGYETVVFNSGPPVPPPAYEPPAESSCPQQVFDSNDGIGEEAVRAAILAFVAKHCCYGSRPAKNMNITRTIPTHAFHYLLETFNESRTTSRKFLPYRGGAVDGPLNGAPPPVWSMHCRPYKLFHTHEQELEVPHTSYLKTCHRCSGEGFVQCGRCHGRGRVRCSSCHGSGRRTVHRSGKSRRVSCSWCHGSGRKRCMRCGGDGRVTCPTCSGFRTLRHFILLTVKYVNNLSDYILERSDMPDELIRNVSGQVVFEQTQPFVWPISQYPVTEVNENSIRLVNEHRTAWPYAMILHQRQTLRSVPVTEAHYDWKDVSTRFWVYGFEHKVHAPDYPHQCCWGCNVL